MRQLRLPMVFVKSLFGNSIRMSLRRGHSHSEKFFIPLTTYDDHFHYPVKLEPGVIRHHSMTPAATRNPLPASIPPPYLSDTSVLLFLLYPS